MCCESLKVLLNYYLPFGYLNNMCVYMFIKYQTSTSKKKKKTQNSTFVNGKPQVAVMGESSEALQHVQLSITSIV